MQETGGDEPHMKQIQPASGEMQQNSARACRRFNEELVGNEAYAYFLPDLIF